ncbi:MAG TPA: PASTA domain-containing protein [Capsulimonadaceae bacterium]|jgi:serine/threonine-protein kinase
MANVLNDRYELIEVLNSSLGDFDGESYKARERLPETPDVQPGRVVLLRRLPAESNVQNVHDAAKRSRQLPRHPNVLELYGLGELATGGGITEGFYAITEYVRGISLRERIRRVAPFSIVVTVDIATSIAQALAFASQHGVTHGHLTPAEVLLTPEGQVRVADFVFSQAVHDAVHSDIAVTGDDIRALGNILFEMLTGTLPAVGSGAPSYSPRSLNANVPPTLDGITMKALSTDPRTKYSSIDELLGDLSAAREDLRAGKPLNWTPLTAASPKQSAKAPAQSLTAAAAEMEQESKKKADRKQEVYAPEPRSTSWLSKLVMALFVVAILGVIGFVIVFATMLTVPSDTEVPNLVGKTYPEAQALAKANHFHLVIESHDYNDVWPANTVYAQSVPAKRQIKSGKDVGVSISDGPPLSAVPDLSQVTLTRAKQMISSAGLPVGKVTDEFNDVVPKGIVTSQDPPAAAMVGHKTPINFTVSKGPSPPPTPSGLSASATIQLEIDLSWNEVANASSYNIYRDGKKVVSGLTQASYSDVHLGANETHTYTVTAVNINGESVQCGPVSATTLNEDGTLPDQSAPAVAPPSVATPAPGAAPGSSPSAPRQRQFHIRFRVPRGGDKHNVQLEVQDATGTNVVYDEYRDGGQVVDENISAFGNKVILRIYLDGKLVRQDTK